MSVKILGLNAVESHSSSNMNGTVTPIRDEELGQGQLDVTVAPNNPKGMLSISFEDKDGKSTGESTFHKKAKSIANGDRPAIIFPTNLETSFAKSANAILAQINDSNPEYDGGAIVIEFNGTYPTKAEIEVSVGNSVVAKVECEGEGSYEARIPIAIV